MASTATTPTLSPFTFLSLHTSKQCHLSLFPPFSLYKLPSLSLSTKPKPSPSCKPTEDIDTSFFDNVNPENDIVYNPPEAPEGFVPPPYFDEGPEESEEDVARAYEELYGSAYSGVSYLGNDVYEMDAKVKKTSRIGSKGKKDRPADGFEERVVQVRRVTKVVKGGKQLHFRAIVVVGDKKGQVGVGVGKAKEVIAAVQKAAVNGRRNIITVPMTKYLTFPHR